MVLKEGPNPQNYITVERDTSSGLKVEDYCDYLPWPSKNGEAMVALKALMHFFLETGVKSQQGWAVMSGETVLHISTTNDVPLKKGETLRDGTIMYGSGFKHIQGGEKHFSLKDVIKQLASDEVSVYDDSVISTIKKIDATLFNRSFTSFRPFLKPQVVSQPMDSDKEILATFEELRQTFLNKYEEEIKFDTKFFIAKEVRIGTVVLPLKSDVVIVAGFEEWNTRTVSVQTEQGQQDVDVLYLPKEPNIASLVSFLEKGALQLMRVLDVNVLRQLGELWNFTFEINDMQNVKKNATFFDTMRMAEEKTEEQKAVSDNVTFLATAAFVVARQWEVARLMQLFAPLNKKEIIAALKVNFQENISHGLSWFGGLSFETLFARLFSVAVKTEGKPTKVTDDDFSNLEKNRLTAQGIFLDLGTIFESPQQIALLLPVLAAADLEVLIELFMSGEISTLEVPYQDFELEQAVMEILNRPLEAVSPSNS